MTTCDEHKIAERRPEAVRVQAPHAHKGVGDALRAAYAPKTIELPAEFADLLAKLN